DVHADDQRDDERRTEHGTDEPDRLRQHVDQREPLGPQTFVAELLAVARHDLSPFPLRHEYPSAAPVRPSLPRRAARTTRAPAPSPPTPRTPRRSPRAPATSGPRGHRPSSGSVRSVPRVLPSDTPASPRSPRHGPHASTARGPACRPRS